MFCNCSCDILTPGVKESVSGGMTCVELDIMAVLVVDSLVGGYFLHSSHLLK